MPTLPTLSLYCKLALSFGLVGEEQLSAERTTDLLFGTKLSLTHLPSDRSAE